MMWGASASPASALVEAVVGAAGSCEFEGLGRAEASPYWFVEAVGGLRHAATRQEQNSDTRAPRALLPAQPGERDPLARFEWCDDILRTLLRPSTRCGRQLGPGQ